MSDSAGGLTQSQYAAARGVTHGAVWRAIQSGLIEAPGGRIDPAQADATWFRRHQQRDADRNAGAESEARREQAMLTTTLAKIQMRELLAELDR